MIVVLKQCRREIEEFPEEIRGDLADALARLDLGQSLSMPLSRPMPSIGSGVHELRLRDRSGIYRVIYWIKEHGEIHLIHGFKKQAQKTSIHNVRTAMERIRRTKE